MSISCDMIVLLVSRYLSLWKLTMFGISINTSICVSLTQSWSIWYVKFKHKLAMIPLDKIRLFNRERESTCWTYILLQWSWFEIRNTTTERPPIHWYKTLMISFLNLTWSFPGYPWVKDILISSPFKEDMNICLHNHRFAQVCLLLGMCSEMSDVAYWLLFYDWHFDKQIWAHLTRVSDI